MLASNIHLHKSIFDFLLKLQVLIFVTRPLFANANKYMGHRVQRLFFLPHISEVKHVLDNKSTHEHGHLMYSGEAGSNDCTWGANFLSYNGDGYQFYCLHPQGRAQGCVA